ncbi:WD40/YVTN/BNR-like repeat-containing protein [Rubrivirga sp.]|uniref:WD40/YVTN/BNR-like repeat-containing protein n=1 Tax=Rubrivirga sp. TaxID=1885344 RepID=UPI003B51BB00
MTGRFLFLALLVAATTSACAQTGASRGGTAEPAQLWAGVIQSKGYFVGATLTQSGLVRFEGDSTWTHHGWNTPRIVGITYDPARPETVFLASGNGVLRTRDGGDSWRLTTDWRITEVQDVSLDPNAPDHVYLASAYGVWRTEDGGDTWAESNSGLLPPGTHYTQTIEVDHSQAGRVLVGTEGGVYETTDGARSWRYVGGGLEVEVLDLQQSRTDPDVWIAATYRDGLRLSADNGRTWADGPAALEDASVHGVAIDPTDARRMVAVGWGTGVHVTEDGGRTWTRRGAALPTDNFYEAVFDANVPGRIWVATLEEGVYHSDDLGRTWTSAGLYGTLVFDMTYVYPATP